MITVNDGPQMAWQIGVESYARVLKCTRIGETIARVLPLIAREVEYFRHYISDLGIFIDFGI